LILANPKRKTFPATVYLPMLFTQLELMTLCHLWNLKVFSGSIFFFLANSIGLYQQNNRISGTAIGKLKITVISSRKPIKCWP